MKHWTKPFVALAASAAFASLEIGPARLAIEAAEMSRVTLP